MAILRHLRSRGGCRGMAQPYHTVRTLDGESGSLTWPRGLVRTAAVTRPTLPTFEYSCLCQQPSCPPSWPWRIEMARAWSVFAVFVGQWEVGGQLADSSSDGSKSCSWQCVRPSFAS